MLFMRDIATGTVGKNSYSVAPAYVCMYDVHVPTAKHAGATGTPAAKKNLQQQHQPSTNQHSKQHTQRRSWSKTRGRA